MQVARLQSQLAAAQLDVQTAREQAALAAIEGSVSPFSQSNSAIPSKATHKLLVLTQHSPLHADVLHNAKGKVDTYNDSL